DGVVDVEVVTGGNGLSGGTIVVKSPPRYTVRPTTARARTLGARPSGVASTPQVGSAAVEAPATVPVGAGGTVTARATGLRNDSASTAPTPRRTGATRRRGERAVVAIGRQVRRPNCPFLPVSRTLSRKWRPPAAGPLLPGFGRRPLHRQARHGVGVRLGEPDVPVWAGRDPLELAVAATDGEELHLTRRRHPADPVGAEIGEPEVPVGAGRDALGRALRAAGRELRRDPVGGDPPDLAAVVLGEPDVAVGAGGDVGRAALGRHRELGHLPGGRVDPADLVEALLGEPDHAVLAGGHAPGARPLRTLVGDGVLLDLGAVDRDAGDPVGLLHGEPEVAVGPGGDPVRAALPVGHGPLGDLTGGCDPADLVGRELREPQVPVRPGRDVEGTGPVGGERPFVDLTGGADPGDAPRGELREPQVAVGPGGDP